MTLAHSIWRSAPTVAGVISLSLSGCVVDNTDLPPVTRIAAAAPCYPVNYLRPPFGPPSLHVSPSYRGSGRRPSSSRHAAGRCV